MLHSEHLKRILAQEPLDISSIRDTVIVPVMNSILKMDLRQRSTLTSSTGTEAVMNDLGPLIHSFASLSVEEQAEYIVKMLRCNDDNLACLADVPINYYPFFWTIRPQTLQRSIQTYSETVMKKDETRKDMGGLADPRKILQETRRAVEGVPDGKWDLDSLRAAMKQFETTFVGSRPEADLKRETGEVLRLALLGTHDWPGRPTAMILYIMGREEAIKRLETADEMIEVHVGDGSDLQT